MVTTHLIELPFPTLFLSYLNILISEISTIHCLTVSQRRQMFVSWNIILSCRKSWFCIQWKANEMTSADCLSHGKCRSNFLVPLTVPWPSRKSAFCSKLSSSVQQVYVLWSPAPLAKNYFINTDIILISVQFLKKMYFQTSLELLRHLRNEKEICFVTVLLWCLVPPWNYIESPTRQTSGHTCE